MYYFRSHMQCISSVFVIAIEFNVNRQSISGELILWKQSLLLFQVPIYLCGIQGLWLGFWLSVMNYVSCTFFICEFIKKYSGKYFPWWKFHHSTFRSFSSFSTSLDSCNRWTGDFPTFRALESLETVHIKNQVGLVFTASLFISIPANSTLQLFALSRQKLN